MSAETPERFFGNSPKTAGIKAEREGREKKQKFGKRKRRAKRRKKFKKGVDI